MVERDRFERNAGAPIVGRKVRNRAGDSPGDFLGRLWALFGAPDFAGDDGYHYSLRDRRTGRAFDAYSGASGPAYGGAPDDRAALAAVLDAFDALLDATAPADCEVEYGGEYGRCVVGVRGGRPFERRAAPAADELARALDDAETELTRPSDDPWQTLGPLGALADAWSRASPHARAGARARAKPIASRLFRETLARGDRLIAAASNDPIRAPFVDAGLEQLRELAGAPLLDGEDAAARVAALDTRLSSSS